MKIIDILIWLLRFKDDELFGGLEELDVGLIEFEVEMDFIELFDMIYMCKYFNLVCKCFFFSIFLFLLYKSLILMLKLLIV